ncbi:MAG TPA: hypothetical protein VGK24_20280 [Candidatus Angelobacter sp.]
MSITTVVALLSSMLSPVMAAACTGTGKAVSCHAGAAPHCDRTMHQHHHDAAPTKSNSAFSAGEDNAQCPMDCCTPGHPSNGAAVSADCLVPPLAVTVHNFRFSSITFTVAGFSSHTDRGPPLA